MRNYCENGLLECNSLRQFGWDKHSLNYSTEKREGKECEKNTSAQSGFKIHSSIELAPVRSSGLGSRGRKVTIAGGFEVAGSVRPHYPSFNTV